MIKSWLDTLVETGGHKDKKSFLQAMLDEHKSGLKAAAALGMPVSTFNEAVRKYRVRMASARPRPHSGGRVKDKKLLYDDRPSNLTTTWKNPDKSPCAECMFRTRDKNQPGCVSCDRRIEYLWLFSAGVPGSVHAGSEAPYRGGGICGVGYQQVY